ncbi:TOBE domain-containing protein [Sulfurimonas sp.]
MSKFLATLQEIKNKDSLYILTFKSKSHTFKMMSLDLEQTITQGSTVQLECKASSVAIAKDFTGELSYGNQLEGRIVALEYGELLTHLYIDIKESIIESLITSDSAKKMNLKVNDRVSALIKSSDLSIREII